MFTNAIVRTPGRSIVDGLSDSKTLGLPNYEQAIIQHQSYIDVLTKCGLDVLVLEPCEEYPDSTFVEDVALITPNCVIINRPGAPGRLIITQFGVISATSSTKVESGYSSQGSNTRTSKPHFVKTSIYD